MKKYILIFTLLIISQLLSFADKIDPDFTVRGFHLDLRVQVMKMPALKKFARQLHDGGVNTLIMEWEATYPFENHPLIPNQFAYTREEVREFVDYCENMGIDVIPLQQVSDTWSISFVITATKICVKIRKTTRKSIR